MTLPSTLTRKEAPSTTSPVVHCLATLVSLRSLNHRMASTSKRTFLLLGFVAIACGCGESENSRRIAELNARLAALEEHTRPNLDSAFTGIETVATAPEEPAGFLGATNIAYDGNFDFSSRKILAEGEGLIRGRVMADGKGREGLRLRLRLSGIVSSWTSSGPDGIYTLHAPPGRYRYDGFELDAETANQLLAGMVERTDGVITGPRPVEASAAKPGRGPDFDFVTAIVPLSPIARDKVRRDSVRLEWTDFPGADRYQIRLMETDAAGRGLRSRHPGKTPLQTKDTFVRIPESIGLTSGKIYLWTVAAFDKEGREISHSPEFPRSVASFEVQ